MDSEDSAQTGLASLLITQVSLYSCFARAIAKLISTDWTGVKTDLSHCWSHTFVFMLCLYRTVPADDSNISPPESLSAYKMVGYLACSSQVHLVHVPTGASVDTTRYKTSFGQPAHKWLM